MDGAEAIFWGIAAEGIVFLGLLKMCGDTEEFFSLNEKIVFSGLLHKLESGRWHE